MYGTQIMWQKKMWSDLRGHLNSWSDKIVPVYITLHAWVQSSSNSMYYTCIYTQYTLHSECV